MSEASTDFDPDLQQFWDLLSAMIRSFLAFERSEVFSCGVTMSQCSTILAIGKQGKMTMNALSESMFLATSTMTRIVDKLVRDGFIERTQEDRDRRVVYVSLTNTGNELLEKIKLMYQGNYLRVVENIPTDQIHKVVEALRLLKDAIQQVPVGGTRFCEKED